MEEIGKGAELRRQAHYLRNVAEIAKNEITRATLLKLAEEYERLAAHPITIKPKRFPQFIK